LSAKAASLAKALMLTALGATEQNCVKTYLGHLGSAMTGPH